MKRDFLQMRARDDLACALRRVRAADRRLARPLLRMWHRQQARRAAVVEEERAKLDGFWWNRIDREDRAEALRGASRAGVGRDSFSSKLTGGAR